jgi:hypothetical protein
VNESWESISHVPSHRGRPSACGSPVSWFERSFKRISATAQ